MGYENGVKRTRNRGAVKGPGGPPRGGRPVSTELPGLVSIPEVAEWLRTTPKAIYNMIARGQLPPPIRVGRRLLFEREKLLRWLEERRALSPQE